MEVVQKLKFPNNSINIFGGKNEKWLCKIAGDGPGNNGCACVVQRVLFVSRACG